MSERHVRAARVCIRAALVPLLVGFFVGLFITRAAPAAERPYVVVYGGRSDPVVLRLVPELVAFGCVVRIDASPAPDPATFTAEVAVVSVTATTVTFWILNPRSGHAPEEGSVDIDDREPEEVELASLRVSEIVRARLLRVEPRAASSRAAIDSAPTEADAGAPGATPEAASDASPAEVPHADTGLAARSGEDGAARTPPPAVTVADARRGEASPGVDPPVAVPARPHLSAGLGPVFLVAPGGTKPALDLALSPEWHASRSLQLRALLAAPLSAPSIVATEGEAAISTWLGGAAVDWQVSSSDDGWRGALGAGAAAVLSHVRGTATAPYTASAHNAVTALPFVEIGGSRGLGIPRVRLGVSGALGLALPEIVVRFAAQKVASWGLPVVGAVSVALVVDIW